MSTKRAKRHAYLVKREQRIKSQNRLYDAGKTTYRGIRFRPPVGYHAGYSLTQRSGNVRYRNYLKVMMSNGYK